MRKRKEDKRNAAVVVVLLLVARLCYIPPFRISTLPFVGALFGLLRPLIYIGIISAWSVSVVHSVINKRLRFYLQMVVVNAILWMTLRTIKWELSIAGGRISHFLVYMYYLPIITMMIFGFFASLYARRGENYTIPKKIYYSVSGISLAMLLFIFANPFHKLYWPLTPDDPVHGIGYYVVVGWIVLMVTMTVVNIIARSIIPRKSSAAVLPLIVIGLIIGYYVTLVFFPKVWNWISRDWTSVTCLSTIALMQACISVGMLPSNKGYAELFEAADDEAVITDDDWNICYMSNGAEHLSKEVLQQAVTGSYQMDAHTLLKGRKLHPGYVVWKEDISAISEILKKLEENQGELSAKYELEKENNRTELILAKAQEKNRLYDASQAATASQNKQLQDVFSRYFKETDEANKKKLLAIASVLGAYIKRKGNLIFADDNGKIKASELVLCFKESLHNLELLQPDCYMDVSLPPETEVSVEQAFLLYDSFEAAIEATFTDLDAALVRIFEDADDLVATYQLVSKQNLSAIRFPKQVQVEQEADTWIVSLRLPKDNYIEIKKKR